MRKKHWSLSTLATVAVFVLIVGVLFRWTGQISYVGYAVTIVLMLMTIFLPLRLVPFVLILFFVGPDTVNTISEQMFSVVEIGSPWRLTLGPFTPGMLMLVIYLAVLIRVGKPRMLPYVRWYVLYAFTFGILNFLIGTLINGELGSPISWVISDIRMVVFFVVSILVFHSLIHRYPEQTYRLVQFLYIVFVVRLLIDMTVWLLGVGSFWFADVPYASMETTGWTAVVVFAVSLFYLMKMRNVIINLPLFLLSTAFVLASAGRMTYIGFSLGILILIFLTRTPKYIYVGIPIFVFSAVTVYFVMDIYRPYGLEAYISRMQNLVPLLLRFDLETTDPSRYRQYVNVFGTMLQDGTIISGRGFGGYWTDSIVFYGYDLAQSGSFDLLTELSRRFPRTHDIFSHFILKLGIVGLILWCAVWVGMFYRIWKVHFADSLLEAVRVALLASAPLVFLLGYWSSKGIILTGLWMVLAEHVYLTQMSRVRHEVACVAVMPRRMRT